METFENQIHKTKFILSCAGTDKYQLGKREEDLLFFFFFQSSSVAQEFLHMERYCEEAEPRPSQLCGEAV